MARSDPALPAVFTLATVEKQGMTRQQAARRVRSGRWRRLQSGVYCLDEVWQAADRRRRHLLRAEAAWLGGPEDRCISHASAAAWHRLPLPFDDTPVWLTCPPGGGTDYRDGVVVQSASMPQQHVVSSDGVRVTALARTVADCLRHLPFGDAVAVGDAALRRDGRAVADVQGVLEGCAGWPYVQRGRQRLPLLDGRRESPLESASFVEMVRHGLPLPEPQALVYDEDGRLVGRSDFWWQRFAVVGEADGLVKYGVGSGDDLDVSRKALVAEKRREDRLRGLGIHVVRWGWAELRDPGWPQRMQRELARGDPARFTGRVRRSIRP